MSGFKWTRGGDDPKRMARAAAIVASLAVAVALAAGARAEMYRCKDAAGREIFTSDAAVCPGAQRHRPARDVQRVQDGAAEGEASARPAARAPAAPPLSEDAQAAMWKRKRVEAEAERRQLRRQREGLEEVVTWCNRGGDLFVEDDHGVRQEYDCVDAKASYAKAGARLAELDRYLEGGLATECRRAGCLPGWIR